MSHFLLQLSLISGLGPAVAERIIAALRRAGIPTDAFATLTARDIVQYCRLSPKMAQVLIDGFADRRLLEQELTLLEKHGITYVTLFDPEYPTALAHTHLAPLVLYCSGDIRVARKPCLAIIGARAATEYGRSVINALVPDIVANGCTIVSGGAIGADTMAHSATLAAGGKTVAVIGSGLLKPYPSQNKRLFEKIAYEGGAVISPFPLTMGGLPGNFPARNRIISGLSQGCLVVQAAQKSGALITAQFALEQGRDVGAVPGPWNDPLSAGCHALIKDGAVCVTSPADALQLVGIAERGATLEQRSLFSHGAPEPQPVQVDTQSNVGVIKNPIVALCAQPISFDELLGHTKMQPEALHDALFDLQIEGAIEQNFMGLWLAVK